MKWTKQKILHQLRALEKGGADLSYNALARRKQSLLSAAAHHFSSYRAALERAGVDYSRHTRRPRWTKSAIVSIIKRARKRGENLQWSAVIKHRGKLARAAFASLQSRLFGSWSRALHAAGLHADDVSAYRRWNRDRIEQALRERAREDQPLNSAGVQRDDPALHAAAVRHFGKYDRALIAAGLKPSLLRKRIEWTRPAVVRELRQASREHETLTDAILRRKYPALYGAAARHFGTVSRARAAAGA